MLQNELDALLYRDRDSREKALEAEIARLRAIINDLQVMLSTPYLGPYLSSPSPYLMRINDLQVSAPNAAHRLTRRCTVPTPRHCPVLVCILISYVVCLCVWLSALCSLN